MNSIIERKLFDEVQQLINLKKPNIDFTPQTNVFTKKIKCICGGTFRRKKCQEKIYWVCRNHDHTNLTKCEIRRIREIVFQKAFISLFNKLREHCKVLLVPMLRQLESICQYLRIIEGKNIISAFNVKLFAFNGVNMRKNQVNRFL